MIKFHGAEFVTSLLRLEEASAKIAISNNLEQLDNFRGALQYMKHSAIEMQLSPVLRKQLNRLIDRANEDLSPTGDGKPEDVRWNNLVLLTREFHLNLRNEIGEYQLLAIRPGVKDWYLAPEETFGRTIVDAFPDAARDVRDAGQCYALDQWTATVFHCMRVLELGLRSLANDLALPDADIEDWKNILDRIEKKVRQMEQGPKSPTKIERVKYYSEAVAQFRLFKDAFRNHVSHSRTSYDEQDAAKVLGAVHDFMLTLVEKPS
ncbi:MAG: hypothetical protein IIC26_06455 [Chloroflexi bacterium]|nr:hypothetical protein [Chloroflexota bacterium]